MENQTSYHGPERRIHKVYVTENTEYHVRRNVCVAVKARTPDADWVEENRAIQMLLAGHFKPESTLPMPGPPQVGFRMYFANGANDIITSPVVAIVRPPRDVVAQYPPDA
jgi:hypothetical protein